MLRSAVHSSLRAAACILATCCGIAALAGDDQKSVLDRVLTPASFGNEKVEVVVREDRSLDAAVGQIAVMGRAPIGYEGLQTVGERGRAQRTSPLERLDFN